MRPRDLPNYRQRLLRSLQAVSGGEQTIACGSLSEAWQQEELEILRPTWLNGLLLRLWPVNHVILKCLSVFPQLFFPTLQSDEAVTQYLANRSLPDIDLLQRFHGHLCWY